MSAGYSANLFLGTIDPLLAGITTPAAQMIDPNYVVGAESNHFFMIASTFVIAALGFFVTDRIVEPRLGHFDESKSTMVLDEKAMASPSAQEMKAMKMAGLAFLGLCIVVALAVVPEDGVLRNPETGGLKGSPFLKGIVVLIFVMFA